MSTRKKKSSKKQSLKVSKNSYPSISKRFSFIENILNGNRRITLQNFKYPYHISKNNNLSIPLTDNKPCDILQYFNQDSKEKKILVDSDGELLGIAGVPYLVCDGKCQDKTTVKLGVKMMLFNVPDLESYIRPEQIFNTVTKSLQNKVNIDILKIKDTRFLTEPQYYEIYGINDNELPQNIEIKMIYLLQELVKSKQTPHINLPILSYQCHIKDFMSKPSKEEKKIFKNESRIGDTNLVNILVSEWSSGGSLESYLQKNIHTFNSSSIYLDVLFFQLFSLLTTIHRTYPSFRHNDLHLGNLLVEKFTPNISKEFYLYQIKSITRPGKYTNYVIPNVGFQIRLWDYDMSCIEGIINNKTVLQAEYPDCPSLSQSKNQFFDLVKFFFMFDRDVVDDLDLKVDRYHQLIYEDILGGLKSGLSSVDQNDITDSGCLNRDIEKTTPEKLLFQNSLYGGIFENFVVPDSELSKYQFIEKYKVE